MSILLAQVPTLLSPEGATIAYAMISAAAIGASVVTLALARNFETRMILLGLIAAVAAVGYGSLTGAILLAPTLMKIAVILILGGIGSSLCSNCCAAPPDSVKDRTDVR